MDHGYVKNSGYSSRNYGPFQLIPKKKCEIRPSHASAKYLEGAPELPKAVKKEKWQKGCMVKGRNEPAAIIHVAHVIAKVKGISVEEVCEA